MAINTKTDVYKVKNWKDNFEGAKSNTYNNKTTCQMPTKHGLGYKRLVKQENGAGVFGAWCALIQVLSRHKKPRQGYCTDTGRIDGRPYTFDDLELLTDIPAIYFEKMFESCMLQGVDWVEVVNTKDTAGIPQETMVPSDSDLDSDLDLNSDSDLNQDHDLDPITNHGFNNIIIHKPEDSKDVTLTSFEDFRNNDITSVMCAICEEKTGPGVGFLSKKLKEVAEIKGDAKACEIFRDVAYRFWSEIRAGEDLESRTAGLIARIKKVC